MMANAKLYVTALLVLGLCVLMMNFAGWRLSDPSYTRWQLARLILPGDIPALPWVPVASDPREGRALT